MMISKSAGAPPPAGWAGHYATPGGLEGLGKPQLFADAGHPLSVDQCILLAGGWGRFQRSFLIKVSVVYASIGVDNLLAAFLAPALQWQWSLSLLGCQLLSSLWFAGGLVGFLCAGAVADSWGRRPALYTFSLVRCIGNVLTFTAPSLGLLFVARVFTSCGTAGVFSACLSILAEHVPSDSRAWVNQFLSIAWQIGVMFLVIVAYLVRILHWRFLALTLIPGVLASAWLCVALPESPHFLKARCRDIEAIAALKQMACANHVNTFPAACRLREQESAPSGCATAPLKGLLSAPQLWRTAAVVLINFVSSGCYYGFCFVPEAYLGTDMFVAHLGATVLEIPAVLLVAPLADKLGRRWALAGLLGAFGFSLAAFAAVPLTTWSMRIFALLIARGSGQAASGLKWMINAESFPTRSRVAGMALAGVGGQFGGVLGPLLFVAAPGNSLPFLVLGAACLPAALCTLSLPETAGKALD